MLGLAFQFFDRAGHGLNRLVLLQYAEPGCLIRLLLGLRADIVNRGLDPLFNGKLEFALCVVERAFLAYQLGLCLLRLRELRIISLQGLTKLIKLGTLGLEFSSCGFSRFLALRRNNLVALGREPLFDLILDLLSRLFKLFTFLPQGFCLPRDLRVLAG